MTAHAHSPLNQFPAMHRPEETKTSWWWWSQSQCNSGHWRNRGEIGILKKQKTAWLVIYNEEEVSKIKNYFTAAWKCTTERIISH
jgi:hypothetical protein